MRLKDIFAIGIIMLALDALILFALLVATLAGVVP